MDWQTLKNTYPRPIGASDRCFNLLALQRVLNSTQYDDIEHDFSTENIGIDAQYVPLKDRRPSVRSELCRTVVDDAVSLLFGDTHFPLLAAENEDAATTLTTIMRECGVEQIMVKATTEGSVGSSAILLEVTDRKPRLSVLNTAYLTPTFAEDRSLVSVREEYAVSGAELIELGINIPEKEARANFIWTRDWTKTQTVVYVPRKVSMQDKLLGLTVDPARTRIHDFGFVPIVWATNFGASPGDTEGECTFRRAIDIVIEIDYLMSQNGRALRYSCDPTLALTHGEDGDDPMSGGGPAHVGGSASVLNLPPNSSATLLEINGKASAALLAHYRELRALALEVMHGNRAHSDKIASAQSGRAMEMMSQSLVWLSDRMRQSYGPVLLDLLRMICSASRVVIGGLSINDSNYADIDCTGICLRWPPWFPPTDHELLALAQSLVTAVEGMVLSNQTACNIYAARIGIEDGEREWKAIQEEIKTLPKKQPSDILSKANAGVKASRHVTA